VGGNRGVTEGQQYVQSIFGTLMQGIPLPPPEGISAIEQIDGLIPLFAGKIALIEQRDNIGQPEEIQGLQAVAQYLGTLMQQLAQNPQEKQRVKQYGDVLGKLMNQVKGLAQRGQEQQAKQQNGNGGLDPETTAKIHAMMATSAAKLHAKQQADALKAKQQSEKFVREERRKDAGAWAEIGREKAKSRMRTLEE